MKRVNTIYWIVTILFALMMLGSAIPDIIMSPMAVDGMHRQLGYPLYFIPFIGVAKALGVVAILVPVHHRLREWAYAGLIFDLVGATFSIIAAGMPVSAWAFMALPLTLGFLSWFYHHKRLSAKQHAASPSRGVTSVMRAAI